MTEKKEDFIKQFGQYKFWVGEHMVMEKLDLVWEWIDKNFTPKVSLPDELPHERVVKPTLAEIEDKADRIVIVDHKGRRKLNGGRIVDKWNSKLEFSIQDDGRTIKIFIRDKNEQEKRSKIN